MEPIQAIDEVAWFKITNYHTGKFESEIGVGTSLEDLRKAGQIGQETSRIWWCNYANSIS